MTVKMPRSLKKQGKKQGMLLAKSGTNFVKKKSIVREKNLRPVGKPTLHRPTMGNLQTQTQTVATTGRGRSNQPSNLQSHPNLFSKTRRRSPTVSDGPTQKTKRA